MSGVVMMSILTAWEWKHFHASLSSAVTAHPTLHCPVIFVLTLPWCSDGSVTSSSMSSRTTVDILPLSLFVPEVVLFTFCHLCRLSQTAQCLVSAQSWWIPADGHLPCLPVNWTYWEEERTNKHRVCKSRCSLRQLFADLNLRFDRKPALSLHLPENCMPLLEILFSSI